ncbi:putative SnoaL-like polyketide cyclase [Actinoplanes missouriensis 431]|uniref:Putative SnoaL-like polyketide cyclase n=1 Tax=Actinoplanes missouriensis (strain ATCC 14538 / DSM 43046 / CBS 188.64 / JCM 3121 / NBRC 102363 / NCIMB 12654 / NRRL B-3342 / UNCC 431) TaxID=512565 RepID=I0HAZ5_ACTM4|nr:nuclear transport factor 2 family protein [Actinoplanes missouriensis]BAL90182.1 putative SnoaL-like polyketide cyclase [Actinoplanes missouriensis 431]
MEREDRIRKYYELVDGGDVPGLVELFAPDAVYRRPGYDPLVGRDELTRFYSDQRVIRDGRHRLSEVVVQGDSGAVHGTFEGTLKNGSVVALRFADFFTFSDGGPFRSRDTFFFVQLV